MKIKTFTTHQEILSIIPVILKHRLYLNKLDDDLSSMNFSYAKIVFENILNYKKTIKKNLKNFSMNPKNFSAPEIKKLVVYFNNDKPIAWVMSLGVNKVGFPFGVKSNIEIWRYTKIEFRERGISKMLSKLIDKNWKNKLPSYCKY